MEKLEKYGFLKDKIVIGVGGVVIDEVDISDQQLGIRRKGNPSLKDW